MKKTLYIILLCGLSLLLLPSCEKEKKEGKGKQAVSTMKGVFYTAVTDAETTLQLLPGKGKTLDAHVSAKDGAVSDVTLKMSLKVDADAVDAYNQAHPDAQAELLPSSAYSFVSNDMMLARYNESSTSAKIRVAAIDLEYDKLYVLPLTIDKVEGTDNWELAENPQGFITMMQSLVGPEGGDGSMEFPYELSTVQDLLDMPKKLSLEEKVFFKLMNDIDMTEMPPAKNEAGEVITDPDTGEPIPASWVPLNAASPYGYAIDFDGNGHTISNFYCNASSYPSFFGVLNGYCHDVTFKDAVIESGADSGCGILGGYGGTGDIHADVARVHVHGKVTLTGNKTGVGGMFGTLGNATIAASSADCEVTSSKNFVGGLFGYAKGNADKCVVEISNCWTSGSVSGNQRVGGIGGGTDKSGYNVRIINCYSTSVVSGTYAFGGIGGHFNLDSSENMTTNQPNDVFENCIAWNPSVKSNTSEPGSVAHYSAAAVVGFTAAGNYLTNCFRRPDMEFVDYSDLFSMYDQDNASPTAPLVATTVAGANYNFPYHGKAAEPGKTASQLAQELGWSATIWDFSADLPTIRPDAQVGPVPDVTLEGQLPGFDENDIN